LARSPEAARRKNRVLWRIPKESAKDSGHYHLHQQLHAHAQDGSLLNYSCNAVPELKTITAEIHRLEHDLQTASGDDQTRRLERLGDLQHEFEHLGGYDMKARAEAAYEKKQCRCWLIN
jgi:ATPase subunit of ABC transporter with duplicated ATPase domains